MVRHKSVIVILLQDSKGEGLSSSAFGGSGLESVLGGHGATTFLSRLTTWTAISFMVIALLILPDSRLAFSVFPLSVSFGISDSDDSDSVASGTTVLSTAFSGTVIS